MALLLGFVLCTNLSAQPQEYPNRKKVGLVLGGGGAKGVAHVGVLKYLNRAGIPIDYIAGTSMGAIVGGLYAIGYSVDELDSMFRSQNWIDLMSDKLAREDKLYAQKQSGDLYVLSFPLSVEKLKIPSGIIKGQNVYNMLTELTIGYHGDIDFDSLPIPFACVTYDMIQGKEVVVRNGDLPLAIRSSMSIPAAFTPVLRDSMVLVDGGIYNNFPVDVVRQMGADVVIGVDVFSGEQNYDGLQSMMGLIDQITTIMGREKYEANKQDVDLYFHPNIKGYTAASFSTEAIDTLLMRGETAASDKWLEIMTFKRQIGLPVDYTPPTVVGHKSENDSLYVGKVLFSGLNRNEEDDMRREIRIPEQSMITKGDLNRSINRLRGSGGFSYITFSLDTHDPYNLLVSVDEKQAVTVNLGARFDTQDMASLLLNTTLQQRGFNGARLGISLRLNSNPYINLDLASRRILWGRLGVRYMYKHNNFGIYDMGRKQNSVTSGQNLVEAYFGNLSLRNFDCTIGAQWEHFNYTSFLYALGSESTAVNPEGFINYFIRLEHESMDDIYYPQKGWSLRAGITTHTSNGIQYKEHAPFSAVTLNYRHAISIGADRAFAIIPALHARALVGNQVAFPYLNCLGGNMEGRYMAQQIPFTGISDFEITQNSLMCLSIDARYQIFKQHYISLRGSFGIQDNNFFNMLQMRDRLFGWGVSYSYNSPIGPIELFIDGSAQDNDFLNIYLNIGKYF